MIGLEKEHNIPPQFVNVTEDARIEKLMKRRYGGLAKTFYGGYKELNEEDFFQLEDEDISTYNLADRANLYFKIGNFLSFDFTVEEQNIINQIANAETFTEALDAAEVLYKYCKQKQQEETKVNLDSHENQQSGSGSNSASDFMTKKKVRMKQKLNLVMMILTKVVVNLKLHKVRWVVKIMNLKLRLLIIWRMHSRTL
jgi:hypothetical protein